MRQAGDSVDAAALAVKGMLAGSSERVGEMMDTAGEMMGTVIGSLESTAAKIIGALDDDNGGDSNGDDESGRSGSGGGSGSSDTHRRGDRAVPPTKTLTVIDAWAIDGMPSAPPSKGALSSSSAVPSARSDTAVLTNVPPTSAAASAAASAAEPSANAPHSAHAEPAAHAADTTAAAAAAPVSMQPASSFLIHLGGGLDSHVHLQHGDLITVRFHDARSAAALARAAPPRAFPASSSASASASASATASATASSAAATSGWSAGRRAVTAYQLSAEHEALLVPPFGRWLPAALRVFLWPWTRDLWWMDADAEWRVAQTRRWRDAQWQRQTRALPPALAREFPEFQ
jgi:hypothetical protein